MVQNCFETKKKLQCNKPQYRANTEIKINIQKKQQNALNKKQKKQTSYYSNYHTLGIQIKERGNDTSKKHAI